MSLETLLEAAEFIEWRSKGKHVVIFAHMWAETGVSFCNLAFTAVCLAKKFPFPVVCR